MKNKVKVKGQILVIILLVLSILSIFILAMVSNARKDSQERRDNKRYEQFYAIAEKKLIEVQGSVGIQQISQQTLAQTLTGYTCTTALLNEVWADSQSYECSKTEEFSSYESGSTETITSTLYFTDDPVLQLFEMPSDNSLRIALIKNNIPYTDIIKVYWKIPNNTPVYWEITLDYFAQSVDPNQPSYKSLKVSTLDRSQPSTSPNIIKTPAAPYYINGVNFTNGISFSVQDLLNAVGVPGSAVEALRIKPIIGVANTKVSIGILPADTTRFPSQFRRITSVINTTAIDANSSKSPTPILNMQYPISLPVNPLLDYVYRGGYFEQILAP